MKLNNVPVVLAAVLALAGFAVPAQADREDLLHISFIDGNVQINTEDTGDWVPASVNMPLRVGDRLWVPDRARMELMMRNGSTLRLDQLSALDVDALDMDYSVLYLKMGRLYANFRGTGGDSLRIDTPDFSVHAYNRAVFRMDLPEDSDFNDVVVLKGSVTVESKQEIRRVDEGAQYSLRRGMYPELTSVFPSDEWERWNRSRDEVYALNQSARYLPEELQPYGPSLDPYGGWVYVPVYGYCWRPRVAVSDGWAPYHNGRWCWIDGNYVWISYEPWGYVPHHYGRWLYSGFIGWVWVPPAAAAVQWGPGYVGWAVSGTHVAWLPLGPRDVYYGQQGYAGKFVGNVPISKTIYQNITVKNAITVVHNETFIHGKHVAVNVKENPFLHQQVVARPDFQPERATKIPVIKTVAQHENPPAQVRDIPRRAVGGERSMAGLKGRPADENRVSVQAQRAIMIESGDAPAGKPHEQTQAPGPLKIEQRPALSGEPIKKAANPGIQERRLQGRVASGRLVRSNDPVRQKIAKPEEIKEAYEAPRKYTNEDLKRFERAGAPEEPARQTIRERIASAAPAGDKSLRGEPATPKWESIATPQERKQSQSIGREPTRDAQRFNSRPNAQIQSPAAEARDAQRDIRKADRPAREIPRETQLARQFPREGRAMEVKPLPSIKAEHDGAGQAAIRGLDAKTDDAVKEIAHSAKTPSAAGPQGGSFSGPAGKIGGLGRR
jgi:hypothetical protein